MSHVELRPEDITVIIDRREQLPLDITPMKIEYGTLPTSDYSVKGLEQLVAVERKSLQDLLGCIGNERERFDKEMQRILAYPHRLLVVEDASWLDLEAGFWRSKITPAAVRGSLLGWMAAGIPVLLTPTRASAAAEVSRFLFIAARRRWREATSLCPALKLA